MSALRFLLPGVIPLEDFHATSIKAQQVAPGILMLVGLGGNIGVSYGKDATFMIDGQFGPLSEKILDSITEYTDHPVQFLLNTHWHLDHVAANEELAQRGITIMAHEEVRSRMSTDQVLPAFGCTVPAFPSIALPRVTFTEDLHFHWNDEIIEIFHAPGAHTDGDVMVHFHKANVIQMSDIYFNGMYPLIDVDCGGSIDGMIQAVEEVLSRCDEQTKIIPGHGDLSDPSELEAYRDMMVIARDTISSLIDQGKSLQDILDSKPTSALDADWGQGVLEPDGFVQHIYASIIQPS
ncbi:MAG: MBL fold metallo-hydrolase [Bacteroidetes bacterium]|nr:MBL fold metallo-hydrolase [Bacteroidota bacterium]